MIRENKIQNKSAVWKWKLKKQQQQQPAEATTTKKCVCFHQEANNLISYSNFSYVSYS